MIKLVAAASFFGLIVACSGADSGPIAGPSVSAEPASADEPQLVVGPGVQHGFAETNRAIQRPAAADPVAVPVTVNGCADSDFIDFTAATARPKFGLGPASDGPSTVTTPTACVMIRVGRGVRFSTQDAFPVLVAPTSDGTDPFLGKSRDVTFASAGDVQFVWGDSTYTQRGVIRVLDSQ